MKLNSSSDPKEGKNNNQLLANGAKTQKVSASSGHTSKMDELASGSFGLWLLRLRLSFREQGDSHYI